MEVEKVEILRIKPKWSFCYHMCFKNKVLILRIKSKLANKKKPNALFRVTGINYTSELASQQRNCSLRRLCQKLHLFRRENHASSEKVAASVQAAIVYGQMWGYWWLYLGAIQRKYIVSQDTIRQLIRYWSWRCGAQMHAASVMNSSLQQRSKRVVTYRFVT